MINIQKQQWFKEFLKHSFYQNIDTKLNFLVCVSDGPGLQYSKHSTIFNNYNGNIRLIFEK
jgi:hypothetical protein